MNDIDFICGYDDPAFGIAGHIYCSDSAEALDMAERTGGTAWVETWVNGEPMHRAGLVRLEVVTCAKTR